MVGVLATERNHGLASDELEQRKKLIANESTKLVANALDRASTACLTVGVFGPIVATLYGVGATTSGAHGVTLVLGSALWLAASGSLHWMARRTLRRLK